MTADPNRISDRLEALSRAVWSGASNPRLIERADKIADALQVEHPDLAARLRRALRTKGESLGTRYARVQAIAADLLTEGDDVTP